MRLGRVISQGARSLTGAGIVYDIYRHTTAVRPPLILVHGGGWTTGGRYAVADEARSYANLGWPVFAIGYTLSPNSPLIPIKEVQGFIQHVRDNASTLGVNGDLVAAQGYSAGAQLVFMAAITGTTGGTRPNVAAGMSGPYRLRNLTDSALNAAEAYLGLDLSGNEAAFDAVSPYYRVGADCCPIRMVHNDGEDESQGEVDVQQTEDMEDAALAAGMVADDVSKVIKVGTTHPVTDATDTSAWFKTKLGVSW